MRVAALYDVHGNLPALEAVLDEVERDGIDAIVSGGDVVWGPMPSECLERLRAADARFVRGNADRDVLGGTDPIDRFAAGRLSEEQRAFVLSWPLALEHDVVGLGRILFCHATPRSDEEIVTRLTPEDELAEVLVGVEARCVVVGHTHVQFDRQVDDLPRLVNAGAVGMPYEGNADARWALLAPDVELRRTPYDVESAIRQIEATGMPQVERLVENALRGRVTAEEATALWERERAKAK